MIASDAQIKVSVLMITYNHEAYISKAIESVLEQKTNFKFELVIGEDCSTDNTRSIVENYQKKNPEIIRLLESEQNLGAFRNAQQTYNACRGEYIALLEGDDYWIDPLKLQKQVDYLEKHPECVLCFHPFTRESSATRSQIAVYPPDEREKYTFDDIMKNYLFQTCTVLLRNHVLESLPDWFEESYATDWPFFILLAQHGDIGYIKDIMSCYRDHGKGKWSGLSQTEQSFFNLKTCNVVCNHLENSYKEKSFQALSSREKCLFWVLIFSDTSRYPSLLSIIKKMRKILSIWPPEVSLSKKEKIAIWELIITDYYFLSAEERNFIGVMSSFPAALIISKKNIRNRGFFSVFFQSFLGKDLWGKIKKVMKSVLTTAFICQTLYLQ